MKKSLLIAALLLAGNQYSNAQAIQDTVSIGAGYTNETWYSLENGEQGTKPAAEWDLAFDLGAYGASIRVNNGNGILVYPYPHGDTSDWASVDTAGITNWNAVYNAETDWKSGALNQNVNENDPFDMGWGVYDMNTHFVLGDSIFVIKLMDNSYRKLRIDKMGDGVYDFTFAHLDGTNEVQASLTKSDYTGKLFGYYSIENETVVDHEPVAVEDWDLFFGKYTGFIPTPYNLTGIIAGPKTEVVQIDGVADVANYNDWGAESFTTDISTIGADWKSFDMSSFAYVISNDIVYFVKTGAGDVWKFIPTGFGGSSNGNFEFTKEKLSSLSTNENGLPNAEMIVYPNPASESVSVLLNNMNAQSSNVQILSIDGQVMFEQTFIGESNFEVRNIDINLFTPGIYLINVQSGNQQFNQKLIVK